MTAPARAAAVQRVLDLQRGAGNHAVAAILARLPIKGLKVDTAKDEPAVVKKALMSKWNKTFGLTVDLSRDEAQALLDLLEGDLDEDVVEELEDLAKGSEEEAEDTNFAWDDDDVETQSSAAKEKKEPKKETKHLKKEKESGESSSEEDFPTSFSSFSFLEKKKPAVKGPVDKKDLGARAVRVMKGLGHTIFLAGGGGVTMLGSPRAIKDLDFRIELPCSWYDEDGEALLERINIAMSKEFEDKVRFNVSDVETAYTIKTVILGVEVSMTRTPKVSYLLHGGSKGTPPVELPALSGFDLILDKAYSLIMRTERPKMCTDLFDLLFALNKSHGGFHGGCSVLRFLGSQRGVAYAMQGGRRKLDKNMLVQLHTTLSELLASDYEELEEFFKKLGALDLLKLAPVLLTEIEGIMAKSGDIKVYM